MGMRLARLDQAVLRHDDGKFIGICLGYDFTSEHEWGINGIKQAFGIPPHPTHQVLGAEARAVTLVPAKRQLRFLMARKHRYLMFSPSLEDRTIRVSDKTAFDRMLEHPGTDLPLSAAWDETSFGIRTFEDSTNALKLMFDALCDRDAMIYLNGAKPFGGSGLMLCIRSAMPAEVIELMRTSDIDRLDLLEAAEATGIAAQLQQAGKRYFALSPRWADDKKTSVVFWLNPMDQQNDDFGWFTVADLTDWIRGQGKIPKQPQKA